MDQTGQADRMCSALTTAAELLECIAAPGFYFTEWPKSGNDQEVKVRRERAAAAAAEARAALAEHAGSAG